MRQASKNNLRGGLWKINISTTFDLKWESCGSVALFASCFQAFPKHVLPSTPALIVDTGHELEGLTCFTQRPVVVARLRATFLKPRASSETQLERIRETLGPEDSAALLIQSHLPPSLYFQCCTGDITMWLEDSESQIFRRPQGAETLHSQVKPLCDATKSWRSLCVVVKYLEITRVKYLICRQGGDRWRSSRCCHRQSFQLGSFIRRKRTLFKGTLLWGIKWLPSHHIP